MADISTRLEQIIDKLDTRITAPPAHDYGLTIEERIDHISKQLDAMPEGGSSGSSGVMCIVAAISEDDPNTIALDKTWQEIYDFVSGGGFAYVFRIDDEYGVTYLAPIEMIIAGGKSGDQYVVSTSGKTALNYVTYSPNNFPTHNELDGK